MNSPDASALRSIIVLREAIASLEQDICFAVKDGHLPCYANWADVKAVFGERGSGPDALPAIASMARSLLFKACPELSFSLFHDARMEADAKREREAIEKAAGSEETR